MKHIFIFISLIALVISAKAQTGIGSNTGYKKEGNTLLFHNTNGDVKLEFCSPAMFRVRASWTRAFEADEHLMQENYNWPAVAFNVVSTSKGFNITTGKLTLKVNKAPFKIDVYSADGKLLSSESGGGLSKLADTVSSTKNLTADEHFFGFGERMDNIDQTHKLLNLSVGRGKSRDNLLGAYNVLEANYWPVPFFMRTKG